MRVKRSTIYFSVVAVFLRVFCNDNCFAQNSYQRDLELVTGEKPRLAEHADSTGMYEVVGQLNQLEFDPGDSIEVSVFFTGYGMIKYAKLFYEVSSTSVFDTLATVKSGLDYLPNRRLFWGGASHQVGKGGIIDVSEMGLSSPVWQEATPFIDFKRNSNLLVTEFDIEQPPIIFRFKVARNAEPGNYNLSLSFTYFDGKEWQISQQIIRFEISSFVDRHELVIWIIAILGFISLFDSFTNLAGKLSKVLALKKKIS